MLADAAEAFVRFSVNGRLGRAGQLFAEHPEIATYDIRTVVALGDAERVEAALRRDPDLTRIRDPGNGWTLLHLACASRWHVDPARAPGLEAIVRMLLDAGAEVGRPPSEDSQWVPLRCAVASAGSGRGNEPIVRLLLERGATVADHDLYLAGFTTGGGEWCQRLLLDYTPDPRAIVAQAPAAPISQNDLGGVRVLLEAGADISRYRNDDGDPANAVEAAISAGCSLELIELLLEFGADPNGTGEDGRSVYAGATARGRADLVELLARHGARDDATALDRLQLACLRHDRDGALDLLARHADLRPFVADADGMALSGAAETGDTVAIALLLEAGFPIGAHAPRNNGATALHAAAYAGSADVVAQLIEAGAPLEALDTNWNATAIVWALVGSGERTALNASPDWELTVARLIDAGADTTVIDLDGEDPIRPADGVVELLRARGAISGRSPSPE